MNNSKAFVENILKVYAANQKLTIPSTNQERISFFKGLIPNYLAKCNTTLITKYGELFNDYLKIGVKSKLSTYRNNYFDLLDRLKSFKRFVIKNQFIDFNDCLLFEEFNTPNNQKIVELLQKKSWVLSRYTQIDLISSYIRNTKTRSEKIVKMPLDCKEISDLFLVEKWENGDISLKGKFGSFRVRGKLSEKVSAFLENRVNLAIKFDKYKVVKDIELVGGEI